MAETNPLKKLLTTYQRRLTNLSGNNRALFLPRLIGDQFIDIHALSQLDKEKSFSIIESLIGNKRKILCAAIDSRLEATNEASKKLKRLQRLDHFIFEERGSRDLHVGWPFVKGKFTDGTCVRCPLIFFPVELIMENNNWLIKPKPDGEITFNKSLLLAYSFYNNIKVSEVLLEENFDFNNGDSTIFRTELYKLLQEAPFEINFNPDNFRDELVSFTSYKKSEFEDQFKIGELKLFPEAVLGIFPQATSYLVPDYQLLLESDQISDLEEFFLQRTLRIETVENPNFISLVKEEKVYPAFPMDIWQENALKAVKIGSSIVVQGPPGTGKSHLICNLIADAIANRQRVLVVCQKRVALDVVYDRLKTKNISPFIALVHDFKEDRKDIYGKIAKQIESIDEYKQKNNSLNAIQLERKFYVLSRRIDQITEELEEFRSALFDVSNCGVSVKDLYLQSSFGKPHIDLKQEFSNFRLDEMHGFLSKLKLYVHYASQFLGRTYEWMDRKSFSLLAESDFEILKGYMDEVPVLLDSVEGEFSRVLHTEVSWDAVEALTEYKPQIDEILTLIDTEKYFDFFKGMIEEPEAETNSLWLSNIERLVVECFDQDGPEITLETGQLGFFQEVLHKSMKARTSIFGLIGWELFSKDKVLVARVLVSNQLKSDKIGLQLLEQKLDRRLNLEHNLSRVKSKPWLASVPDNNSLSDLKHWFQVQQRIIHAKNLFNSIPTIRDCINPRHITIQEFQLRMRFLADMASKLSVKKVIWSTYFTENQIQLFRDVSLSAKLKSILRRDFSGLVEFDSISQSFSRVENEVVGKLFEAEKVWGYEKFKSLFTNSLSLAWIEFLEKKYPILNCVSSGKLTLLESELRECIAEKLKISNEILLLRARENVTDNLEFNRLNNRITYRDLLHQVTKKKKIWPLRKLVKEHTSELFHLLPCWLASPETVSAIFPMEEVFDLVIFDEASQCFVERGIPAMYRGKQLIVAGDSQQLRPSDLYQSRWQEEENDSPEVEIDSLLELSKRYLYQTDLRHHYRSESLALMEFSNQYFYKGKLKLLPDRMAANDSRPPIEYQKVNGVWHEQTNEVEAEHTATLVTSLLKANPRQSIGVITFNAPQQNLIQDIIELKLLELGIQLNDNVFVKNIENVQGDERDIIIFSVGYALNQSGKLAIHFGSLSQQGGENRLNVAVTRAKRRIIIVTSILPGQLQVEDTINDGPKVLKAYLHYAYQVSMGATISNQTSESSASLTLRNSVMDWCNQNYPLSVSLHNAIPTTDLTISNNKLLEGLLFTDDEPYKTSISAKDRHALLPSTIEEKNWRLGFLYSRNYWQDPHKFFNEVARFITNP